MLLTNKDMIKIVCKNITEIADKTATGDIESLDSLLDDVRKFFWVGEIFVDDTETLNQLKMIVVTAISAGFNVDYKSK